MDWGKEHVATTPKNFFEGLTAVSHSVSVSVVVEGGDVGYDVFPAAVIVDGAGCVVGFGVVVKRTDVISLTNLSDEIWIAPAFVHGCPDYD